MPTLRLDLGGADAERVDPLSLEAWNEIWTVRGKKPFKREFVADAEMLGDFGLTTCDGSSIVVEISAHLLQGPHAGKWFVSYGHHGCMRALPISLKRRDA